MRRDIGIFIIYVIVIVAFLIGLWQGFESADSYYFFYSWAGPTMDFDFSAALPWWGGGAGLAVLLYFILLSNKSQETEPPAQPSSSALCCPSCKAVASPGETHCRHCGTKLPAKPGGFIVPCVVVIGIVIGIFQGIIDVRGYYEFTFSKALPWWCSGVGLAILIDRFIALSTNKPQ